MATHLVDKSAWVRLDRSPDPRWQASLLAGSLAVTGIAVLEILVGSRSSAEFDDDRLNIKALPRMAVTEQIIDRALDVQGLMVGRGTHRAPSPADLILAACAEANSLTVLHYDKDFDLIADVTGQPMEWVASAGSIP